MPEKPVPETPEEHAAAEEHVDTRAELLPEEEAAGSDAPVDQARAILEESEERTQDPEGTWHESTQTPDETRDRHDTAS